MTTEGKRGTLRGGPDRRMTRRQFLRASGTGVGVLALAGLEGCATSTGEINPKAGRRVVVVGGGWGGATAARYVRAADPSIEVVMLEPNKTFVSCPFSNLVLSGVRGLGSLTFGYGGLRDSGVKVRHAAATAIEPDTRRVRIGQMVTCNGYRHPALLAKMASTVDVLSHGRLDFGIGAGWYEHEYRAYGYDYPDVSERLRALHEAIQVILAMWIQEEASFEGSYYQVRGAINQPKGVQHPHIPLLIGGSGEQVTLKLVAQYADACNITNPDIATLERKLAILK